MKRFREEDKPIESSNQVEIKCVLSLCDITFSNHNDYEYHIETFHNYTCTSCHRQFPNNHFLNLHIDEQHNPFVQIKKEQGEPIYQCLVSNCLEIFISSSERELHLIKLHNYPSDFKFDITNTGI